MVDNHLDIGRTVRLTVDLRRWHIAFREGIEGVVLSRGESDDFFWMRLPTGERLQVVCAHAVVVDDEPPTRRHRTDLVRRGDGFVIVCSCGYHSQPYNRRRDAENDEGEHVRLTVEGADR